MPPKTNIGSNAFFGAGKLVEVEGKPVVKVREQDGDGRPLADVNVTGPGGVSRAKIVKSKVRKVADGHEARNARRSAEVKQDGKSVVKVEAVGEDEQTVTGALHEQVVATADHLRVGRVILRRNVFTGGAGVQASGSGVAIGSGGNAPTKKVGRNDPCPCGSGKKYKKCHGA